MNSQIKNRNISYDEIERWFESKIHVLISSVSKMLKDRPEKNQIFENIPDRQVLIQNFSLIEKRWKTVSQVIIKSCKRKINYIFLTEYPIKPNNYIYELKDEDLNNKKRENVISEHISNGILIFDLIPLTVKYKDRDAKTLDNKNFCYNSLLDFFHLYIISKWQYLKTLLDFTIEDLQDIRLLFPYSTIYDKVNRWKEENKKYLLFDGEEFHTWTYGNVDLYNRTKIMVNSKYCEMDSRVFHSDTVD